MENNQNLIEPQNTEPNKKPTKHTLEYKCKVLTFLTATGPYYPNGNISHCARAFEIERKIVSKWQQQREAIFASTHKRTSFRVNNVPSIGRWPIMEVKLNEWVQQKRVLTESPSKSKQCAFSNKSTRI